MKERKKSFWNVIISAVIILFASIWLPFYVVYCIYDQGFKDFYEDLAYGIWK